MDAKKLGKKIKLDRIELDLNQTELADKIGAKQKASRAMKQGPRRVNRGKDIRWATSDV